MKTAVLFTAFFCAAWAFPQGQDDLQFKRLYVDPTIPVADIIFPRITNGKEAVPHSIPYQAYIIITGSSGRWLCGGSLVSTKYVLTAGHCVVGGTSAQVLLGAHNVQQQEATQVQITSTRLILHPGFDEESISNDIGLIELPSAVTLNQNINVIQLPSRSQASATFEDDTVRISGWGLTTGSGSTSTVLREVNSTVISNTACNNYYGIVTNYQVCTSGTGGVGSCNGDSGGPLVDGNLQIGIVSYGVRGCLSGYPSAFTRTNSFQDWLEENTDLIF